MTTQHGQNSSDSHINTAVSQAVAQIVQSLYAKLEPVASDFMDEMISDWLGEKTTPTATKGRNTFILELEIPSAMRRLMVGINGLGSMTFQEVDAALTSMGIEPDEVIPYLSQMRMMGLVVRTQPTETVLYSLTLCAQLMITDIMEDLSTGDRQ